MLLNILLEVESVANTAQAIAQTTFANLNQVVEEMDQSADGLINELGLDINTAGMAIADALSGLPQTAQDLAQEMPKLAHRLRHHAGLRKGDAPRSDLDVMKLFEKIPGTSKLGANETTIREFLADKNGSHIIPRQKGGSNGGDNILWEIGTDNLRRGAKTMTGGEQVYIRCYNAVDSIVKNSTAIAKLGIASTGTAILTQTIVTALSYTLDLYRGEITIEEFRDRVLQSAISAGIAAPIFFLILVAVLALLPELTLLLSAPIVVAGFNALFGISVAIPIIQSINRHLEAVRVEGEGSSYSL
ncbi:HNH endonuclease [Phormidium sp. CLA17]|uniref:hypothetical protein n=1 Tax=Leptolyngbya sp. Cla-17 TaxID=2803751 RepID=UPI0018D8FA90|nr:hypothetical protein [Leptolyngbya sp. Cla-17]MBM0740423.1 HNH endonuclease [Leptolyngbya sp. Cla-17]